MKKLMKDTSILQSVQNGMKILHLFTGEKPIWKVTEISQTLNLNKTTVSRLLKDLVAEGFLQKENRGYGLGYSFLYLSGVITSHLEIYRESKDILQKLVHHLDETAHIAILEGLGITYVHKEERKNSETLLSDVGKKNPLHCTSSGKILLAYQKKEVIDQVIGLGLKKYGPYSVTDGDIFRQQLVEIQKQGYAICIDELHENNVSIAAPIIDYTGNIVASVSVVGAKQRMENKISSIRDSLVQAGERISSHLGYIPDI